MSHPISHEDEGVILKPQARPRRPFDTDSAPNSEPPTPSDPQSPNGLDSFKNPDGGREWVYPAGSGTPGKTGSFLNLTASTLFGIYEPNGLQAESQQPTPWGTGAQTPAEKPPSFDWARANLPADAFERGSNGQAIRRKSTASPLRKARTNPRKGFRAVYLPHLVRCTALFGVGLSYGLLVSQLHDRQCLVPVQVNLGRTKWSYLATWGLIGVLLGEALPWIDALWASDKNAIAGETAEERGRRTARRSIPWIEIVRPIGLFIGIAFAIRRLPWKSTLQLSLTLALANPATWYVIDRSSLGFILSTVVALSGTAVLLGVNPALIPSSSPTAVLQAQTQGHGGVWNATRNALKSEPYVLGVFSQEAVGVATWIASVLFVSSVCFGNIGRRLSPQRV